jgi:hypothetical protein
MIRALALVIVVGMFVTVLVWLSKESGEAEMLNRYGSLVVCVSLAVAAAQFAYERYSEHDLDSIEKSDPISMLMRTALGRNAAKYKVRLHQVYERNRVWLFGASVCFGVIGEFLHGWGDVVLHALTHGAG